MAFYYHCSILFLLFLTNISREFVSKFTLILYVSIKSLSKLPLGLEFGMKNCMATYLSIHGFMYFFYNNLITLRTD